MCNTWTPFCPKKPGIEHAATFGGDLACSYCGKANPNSLISQSAEPNEPILITDESPPARKSDHSKSRFSMLSKESNTARQESITKTRAEERPHAGTPALSTRAKPAAKGLHSLTAKKHRIQVHTHTGQLHDEDLRTYGDWCLLS